MVEITTRVNASMLLLRPCPELNDRILGIIGRALSLYPIALHSFVFLSNHWHALISVPDAQRLSQFLRYVNGNVAKAVKEVQGWPGALWGRRAQTIAVVDDDAAEDRFRYLLAHGAKEGLVASPLDWPGVSSARALAYGEPLVGHWRDRSRERRLSRRRSVSPEEVTTTYPIELAPLPSWVTLSVDERRTRTRALISEIEIEARSRHSIPLGVAAVCRQDPFSFPRTITRTPAPIVHAQVQPARARFLMARASFLEVYRSAVAKNVLAAQELAARFPSGSFPPPLPLSPLCRTSSRAAGSANIVAT